MAPIAAWRFLGEDRRLDMQSPEFFPAESGTIFRAQDTQDAVLRGVWACTDLADAMRHGHGLLACRVRLDGIFRRRRHTITDASELTVEWVGDATRVVNQFTYDTVEDYLLQIREIGREPDARLWAVMEGQRAWLEGRGTESQLEAAVDRARQAHHEIHRRYGELLHEVHPIINAEWHARRGDSPLMSTKEYAHLKARVDEANEAVSGAVSDIVIAMMAVWGMHITTSRAMYMFLMWHQPERQVIRRLEERLLATFDENLSAGL